MTKEELYAVVTPLFTPEMGHRLMIARKRLLKTQTDMARALGVSQPLVAAIETGKVRTCKFSVATLRTALYTQSGPDLLGYVLAGAYAEKFNESAIRIQFEKHFNARKGRWRVGPVTGIMSTQRKDEK